MRLRHLVFGAFAVATAATLSSAPADAVEDIAFVLRNTGDLVDVCSIAEGDPRHLNAIHACMGYLEGVVDYHDAITEHEALKPLICYPPTATRQIGLQVFIDWGQANRDDEKLMGEPSVIGMVKALADKWPCG